MSRRRGSIARRVALGAALAVLGFAVPAGAARVQGTFTMHALVTRAIGVRGEHRGERLTRTWRIVPRDCRHDACATLRLRRTLSRGRADALSLHRRRDGAYTGAGTFFVALRCRGHVHPHGSRVHYTLALRVTGVRTVGGIRFARRIRASYDDVSRTDDTSCGLSPSHDAARYTGRLARGLPHRPRAAFAVLATPGGPVTFTDHSGPGTGPGRRVRAWRWSFGDPGSGAADRSRQRDPSHVFTAAGSYRVTLTVTDAAGLRATTRRTITVAAPAPAPSAAWRTRR